MPAVTVYGSNWCHDTNQTRRHLDDLGVAYAYVNIEKDPKAEQWVKDHNRGAARKPTVKVGRDILCVPKDTALERALLKRRMVTRTAIAKLKAERKAKDAEWAAMKDA